MVNYPSGEIDRRLLSSWGILAGVDEVGRGSLAGPLAVGVVAVSSACGEAPQGLADSKQLRPAVRERMVPSIRSWALASAVGWASAAEISDWGVTVALRTASLRALALVRRSLDAGCEGDVGGVLLDGRHDFLSSAREPALFDEGEGPSVCDPWSGGPGFPVATLVKADQDSHVVAAASVLAKVARDHFMASLADEGYGWRSNKGYASPTHLAALREKGPAREHRRGWKLPGVN